MLFCDSSWVCPSSFKQGNSPLSRLTGKKLAVPFAHPQLSSLPLLSSILSYYSLYYSSFSKAQTATCCTVIPPRAALSIPLAPKHFSRDWLADKINPPLLTRGMLCLCGQQASALELRGGKLSAYGCVITPHSVEMGHIPLLVTGLLFQYLPVSFYVMRVAHFLMSYSWEADPGHHGTAMMRRGVYVSCLIPYHEFVFTEQHRWVRRGADRVLQEPRPCALRSLCFSLARAC